MSILCNGRILLNPLTGVQRYLQELLKRMDGQVSLIQPPKPLGGVKAHLWDQFVLPGKVGKSVLWSPSNSGPLSVRRQVVTVHDVVQLDHPEWVSASTARLYGNLFPALARRVKAVIAVSNFTKERLVKRTGIDASKVFVVHSGVNEAFTPQSPDRVAHTLHVLEAPSANYVLSNCSIEPRKNLDRLLRAWAAASARLADDVWLYISGSLGFSRCFGDYQLGDLPPRVHLLGRTPDDMLPSLISGAKAFVYPSLYEGFGFPPLEAMACGTAVITSNVSAIPEVVGSAAALVDPTCVDEIAEALYAVCTNDDFRRGLENLGVLQAKKFDWDTAANRTLSILKAAELQN